VELDVLSWIAFAAVAVMTLAVAVNWLLTGHADDGTSDRDERMARNRRGSGRGFLVGA
jgi:hypothetical protein